MEERFSFHTIEEALQDLKEGKIVIVVDDEDRENEGDFIALAEKATPEVINFMITEGRGLVCLPMTPSRAQELDLKPMVSQNTDYHGTAFTVSIDHKDTTTGISAYERSVTVRGIMDPNATAADFRRPGHMFPLIAKEGASFAGQVTRRRLSILRSCAALTLPVSSAKSSRKTEPWRVCRI